MDTAAKNRKTAMIVSGVVAGMVAMSFAAVPAYQAFCQVTGWGGTTQRADAPADRVLARDITVRFDATVNQGLPWRFKPEQVSQTLKIGETGLAFYEAENLTDKPVTGRATFNRAATSSTQRATSCPTESKPDRLRRITPAQPPRFLIDSSTTPHNQAIDVPGSHD